MREGVRFVGARGGRVAFTVFGQGPPLIVVPALATHLEALRAVSGFREFHETIARHHTLVLYDRLGSGLSDRERTDFSLESEVATIADLVDHLKLRRFALLGLSQGGPFSIAFACQAPHQVSHLILYGTSARPLMHPAVTAAMRELVLADWATARRAFTAVLIPNGEASDLEAFDRIMDASVTPEVAARFLEASAGFDVTELLPFVQVPTLVINRRNDQGNPVEAALDLASRIPGARLDLVEGDAHPHLVGDVTGIAERILAFCGGTGRVPSAQLSAREAEVLQFVADGCTNAEVAERLVVSVRTVERHLLNAYMKLGVRGRTEAVAAWLKRSAQDRTA